ncbi:hypothetical protein BY996DRAFT_564637 [Phakopsora pachyrhizi]|nr:hypothetical protein BY996DRAFT_564637 [Phakopsora pachyrhizi]
MKLSQSFVVVSLSMAAQTQIGLAAPMPNSPEPGSLHHARSPNPNSAQEEGSLNPIQDLLSRSLNRDDYSERHSRNGSPRHNYDGDGNGLLGVDVNFKRRESVERLERRGLDGLLSPILDITNGIPIAGPLVGSTVIQAEKTLVPVLGAVENLPIVGDVIKPLHLAQRDLLDLVKQLPIVGPVAAPLVTPVNDALSPIIKTVAGPLKSLPIVGDLLSSQKLIRRKITAQKEPAPLLSASIGLKKRENPYNSFNVDSQPLSRAGGAFPIEPSNSLDHLTLPNHIVQAEDHSHGEHPQSSAYDEQYPSATKPQSPNPAKLLRSTSGPTGTESLLDPLSSVSIASHLGTIPMLGSQITSQSSSIPMIRAQSGSNPLKGRKKTKTRQLN